MREELKEKIKDYILDNDLLKTEAGEWFRDCWELPGIQAVISFSGRSRTRESYRMESGSGSDSDDLFVTYLYVDDRGEVMMILSPDDDDELSSLLRQRGESLDCCDDSVGEEWLDLLII